jgi:hypothetical protein
VNARLTKPLAGPADLSSEPQLATFLAGPASGSGTIVRTLLDSGAVPAWEDDGEAHPRAPSRPLTDYGHGWAS